MSDPEQDPAPFFHDTDRIRFKMKQIRNTDYLVNIWLTLTLLQIRSSERVGSGSETF